MATDPGDQSACPRFALASQDMAFGLEAQPVMEIKGWHKTFQGETTSLTEKSSLMLVFQRGGARSFI